MLRQVPHHLVSKVRGPMLVIGLTWVHLM